MTAAAAVRDADIIVVAVPLSKQRTIDSTNLIGKVVIDTMNYWARSTASWRTSRPLTHPAARSSLATSPGPES
jgi:predicted dinucleotide-binding enzyme